MQKIFLTIASLIIFQFTINGQNKEWISNRDSIFTFIGSEHFILYSIPEHLSLEIKNEILNERELAYKQISDFFEISPNLKINIFLFESEQIKYKMTGHKGYGWGFENNIVEVFNDSIKVDPYHELVHVLGYTLSEPRAVLDEGTAVYLSQKLGNRPFSKLLGFPDKSINEILLLLLEKDDLFNLPTLFSYRKIGDAGNVVMAYCESASFVEFLLTHYDKSMFIEFYRSLSASNNNRYKTVFFNIYKKRFKQVEKEWITLNGLQ